MSIWSGKIEDDAAGRKSRSAFIAQAAFWFAAFKFLVSGVSMEVKFHGYELLKMHFGSVDAALLGAFLLPCLALYWGRRASDSWPLGKGIVNSQVPTPSSTQASNPVG